jgi:hypothetical protein
MALTVHFRRRSARANSCMARVRKGPPRRHHGLSLWWERTAVAIELSVTHQRETQPTNDTDLVTVVATDPTTARRLTRADVAALMGISPSTVVRRERAGLLRAQVVDGVHVFDETEVKHTITTLRHRTAISALGGAAGDVAALVFTELDAGATPIEIVKRHAVAPTAVKALVAQYREFRDEVTISREELASLRNQAAERSRSAEGVHPSRPVKCMGCDGEQRVRACAACLVSERADIERQHKDGVEEVRFALRDGDGGTTYVSDWTPIVDSDPLSE